MDTLEVQFYAALHALYRAGATQTLEDLVEMAQQALLADLEAHPDLLRLMVHRRAPPPLPARRERVFVEIMEDGSQRRL